MRRKYVIILAVLMTVFMLPACRRSETRFLHDSGHSFEMLEAQREVLGAPSPQFTFGRRDPAPVAVPPPAPASPPPPQSAPTAPPTALTRAAIPFHSGPPVAEDQRQRHIIKTGWTELETEYFDNIVQELRQIAPSVGGYVESENLSAMGWRVFNVTLRIPSANFEDIMLQIENLADVRHSRQTAEDVTDQFYDTAARLATRRIEEERLLALIEEATYVRDILDLERRLSETRIQIDLYAGQMVRMKDQIAYSTIHVTLFDITDEPVVPLAGPTLGDRIGGAFGDSVNSVTRTFQDFVVALAGSIIPIAVWGGLIVAAFLLIRKAVRARLKQRV